LPPYSRVHRSRKGAALEIMGVTWHGEDSGDSLLGQDHVRVHGAPPLFKLYLINDEEAFFGFSTRSPSTPSRSRASRSRSTTR
jgi:hypothetical protein